MQSAAATSKRQEWADIETGDEKCEEGGAEKWDMGRGEMNEFMESKMPADRAKDDSKKNTCDMKGKNVNGGLQDDPQEALLRPETSAIRKKIRRKGRKTQNNETTSEPSGPGKLCTSREDKTKIENKNNDKGSDENTKAGDR